MKSVVAIVILATASCSTSTSTPTTAPSAPATAPTTTAPPTTSTAPPPPVTTATVPPTTTIPPTTTTVYVPWGDVAAVVEQAVTRLEAETSLNIDDVASGVDLVIPDGLTRDCDVFDAYSLPTVLAVGGAPAPVAVAGVDVALAFETEPWTAYIAEFDSVEAATVAVAAVAAVVDACPSGLEQIPLTDQSGAQAVDAEGNPTFIEANFRTTPIDVPYGSASAGFTTDVAFVDAGGDATVVRLAFQHGPVVGFVTGTGAASRAAVFARNLDAAILGTL